MSKHMLPQRSKEHIDFKKMLINFRKLVTQGRGLGLDLTQNSWFNSCYGLFSP